MKHSAWSSRRTDFQNPRSRLAEDQVCQSGTMRTNNIFRLVKHPDLFSQSVIFKSNTLKTVTLEKQVKLFLVRHLAPTCLTPSYV